MGIVDGGPKRPTHNITADHEDWAPGVGLGLPIPIQGILEEDYIISVQGRVRATGTVSEVTDWVITDGGGAVESPTRGFAADDFLVRWHDRHQTPDDLVAGDPASQRGGDFNLRQIATTFSWFKNEDIVFVPAANRHFDSDTTIPGSEKDDGQIKYFGGWPATGTFATGMTRILDVQARAEIGVRRVTINGRTWSVITNRTNEDFGAADFFSSGFQITKTVPAAAVTLAAPWIFGAILRNRDPLGVVESGNRSHLVAGPFGSAVQISIDGTTNIGALFLTGDDGVTVLSTGASFSIDDNFFCLVATFDGADSEIRIDGVTRASGDTGTASILAADPVGIGAIPTGPAPGNGAPFSDYAEMIALQPAGNTVVAARQVEDYLLRKFGFRGLGSN